MKIPSKKRNQKTQIWNNQTLIIYSLKTEKNHKKIVDFHQVHRGVFPCWLHYCKLCLTRSCDITQWLMTSNSANTILVFWNWTRQERDGSKIKTESTVQSSANDESWLYPWIIVYCDSNNEHTLQNELHVLFNMNWNRGFISQFKELRPWSHQESVYRSKELRLIFLQTSLQPEVFLLLEAINNNAVLRQISFQTQRIS